jgi:hypothetical protein
MAKAETMSEEAYNKTVFEEGGALVVDLASVEEAKFVLIPKGVYDATIDGWDYGNSENSGYPMFTGIFEVDHADYQGQKLRSYFSFSPKALPFTKAALNRFAKDIFDKPFKPEAIADSGDLIGRKVRIKVGHQDYEGEKRSKIDQVLAPASDAAGSANNGAGKSSGKFF